jgi:hypothetical protein
MKPASQRPTAPASRQARHEQTVPASRDHARQRQAGVEDAEHNAQQQKKKKSKDAADDVDGGAPAD